MSDDLDQETKDRIQREEAYRAQVRAEEERKAAAIPVPLAAAPAQKKGGLSCGGLIFGTLIGLVILYACAQSFLPSTTGLTSSSEAGSPATSVPVDTWGYTGIGNGIHQIGNEMPLGTYRTRVNAPGCYWARLAGLSGEMSDLKANDNARGPAIVTINSSDAAFETRGCAPWTTDLSAVTSSPDAPFGDGTFIVGTDVSPGTWKATDATDCYWSRLDSFGGGTGSIIANDNGGGIVTISSDDAGFSSSRCGEWTKQ
jgi:hypothetical protein